MRDATRQTIERYLADHGTVTSSDLARATGLTRQAVHPYVTDLIRRGHVVSEGRGRATRYHAADFHRKYQLAGLAEDQVWRDFVGAIDGLREGPSNVSDIIAYALTEMVNNAIDHSAGTVVDVRVHRREGSWKFEVRDDGRGAFRHVANHLELGDAIAAVQQLSMGKVTTDPERHSGEGIFFTSKAVDSFELASNEIEWVVDNVRDDQALGDSDVTVGTVVRWTLDTASGRALGDVFDAYTDGHRFTRSRTVVALFEYGERFVSRSEARRVIRGLERFEHIVIDFDDVRLVGQGFVDELFRVWARAHPEVRLEPMNCNDAVDFMVRRGLARADEL